MTYEDRCFVLHRLSDGAETERMQVEKRNDRRCDAGGSGDSRFYAGSSELRFLDTVMPALTRLGDSGVIWIVLAAALLLFPRTRKYGLAAALALVIGALLCNVTLKPLVARLRPFEIADTMRQLLIDPPSDFPFRRDTPRLRSRRLRPCGCQSPGMAGGDDPRGGHRVFTPLSLCPLSDRRDRWSADRSFFGTGGLCASMESAEKGTGSIRCNTRKRTLQAFGRGEFYFMNTEQVYRDLSGLVRDENCIVRDALMKNYTTFRIGGPADLLIQPSSEEELIESPHICGRKIFRRWFSETVPTSW